MLPGGQAGPSVGKEAGSSDGKEAVEGILNRHGTELRT